MFITCIMIRLFYSQKKLQKHQKNHTNNVVTTTKNKHKNHNAFSIIKNILPTDAGVMVDYHTLKKFITLDFVSGDNLP